MKYLMTALLFISSTSFAETICVKKHRGVVKLELKAPKPPLPCFVYLDGKEIYIATADKSYCPKMLAKTVSKYTADGYTCTPSGTPTDGFIKL